MRQPRAAWRGRTGPATRRPRRAPLRPRAGRTGSAARRGPERQRRRWCGAGLLSDGGGEADLVARFHGDPGVRHVAAGRDVDQVDAECSHPPREHDGALLVPGALDPVGGRDPDEERLVLRPGRPHRGNDLQREPHPTLDVTAVAIGAEVGDRVQELVQQVPVCPVQLDDVETGVDSAQRRRDEVVKDLRDPGRVERRRLGVVAERNGGRCDGEPAAVLGRNAARPVPGPMRRGLAAGMGELHPDRSALDVHEVDDAHPGPGVRVGPDAGRRASRRWMSTGTSGRPTPGWRRSSHAA